MNNTGLTPFLSVTPPSKLRISFCLAEMQKGLLIIDYIDPLLIVQVLLLVMPLLGLGGILANPQFQRMVVRAQCFVEERISVLQSPEGEGDFATLQSENALLVAFGHSSLCVLVINIVIGVGAIASAVFPRIEFAPVIAVLVVLHQLP